MPFEVKQILPYLQKSNQTQYRVLPCTKQYLWQSLSNRQISSSSLTLIKQPHRQTPSAQFLVGYCVPSQSSIKPRVWLPGISSIPKTYRTALLRVGRSADPTNFFRNTESSVRSCHQNLRHGYTMLRLQCVPLALTMTKEAVVFNYGHAQL